MGTSTDWIVSDEPNATGGYTLLAFIGDLEDCKNVEVDDNYFDGDSKLGIWFKHFLDEGLISEMVNTNAYTINIPNVVDGKNITELGDSLFQAGSSGLIYGEYNDIKEPYMRIKKVVIPEGIVKINGYYDLESETIIGSFVFNFSLSEIFFPSTLKSIGDCIFMLDNIRILNIPKNLETIGVGSFSYNSITSLTFAGATDGTSHLKTIGFATFLNIITNSVIIPSSVETIGERAFVIDFDMVIDDHAGLTSLTFAGATNGTSRLASIGDEAFEQNNLSTIVIPKSVETIGSNAFYKYAGVRERNPWTSIIFAGFEDGTSHLQTIEEAAFKQAALDPIITSPHFNLTIPSTVGHIGYQAFDGINNLDNITVKRSGPDGMELGSYWNGTANVIWDGN